MSGPWQDYLQERYDQYMLEGDSHEVAKAKAWADLDMEQFDYEPEEDDDGSSDSND